MIYRTVSYRPFASLPVYRCVKPSPDVTFQRKKRLFRPELCECRAQPLARYVRRVLAGDRERSAAPGFSSVQHHDVGIRVVACIG